MKTVQPANWPAPRGYVNGVVAEAGRTLVVHRQRGLERRGIFLRATGQVAPFTSLGQTNDSSAERAPDHSLG